MVEVKCPYYRQLHPHHIPLWYWWQVQAQLEATGLEEADYVEYCTVTGALNAVRVLRNPQAGAMLQHVGSKARVRAQLMKDYAFFNHPCRPHKIRRRGYGFFKCP